MMKRIIGAILVAMLLLTSVYAAEITPNTNYDPFPVGYLPGESHRSVDKDDFISDGSVSATATAGGVQINAGGSAKFGFYMRYATRSVTVKYTAAENTVLTMTSGDNAYTLNLDGSGEQNFLFYQSLSTGEIAPQAYAYNGNNYSYYYREFVEKRGEKDITIATDGDILLRELVFEKEKVPVKVQSDGDQYIVNTVEHRISDEERIFMTTILIDENASAIFVNGARRYVSNEETTMRPYNNRGTLYLPIETLAKALGYYCEDNPDLAYALMRSDTHEVVMIGGECTVSQGVGARTDVPMDAFIYRNGKTLAAVRYFAELAGKTVVYDNGLVVIDNKYAVADILADESLRAYADSMLEDFKTVPVPGKTYYVAQAEGDDSNLGSEEYPFATISKAAAIAVAGDTVIVKDGVYTETLKPANSGSSNAPINFIAMPEDTGVVISAADEVDGWEKVSASVLGIADPGKDIYRAYIGSDWDLGATQNQVFVNDVMQTEARYPDGPGILLGDSGEEGPNLSKAWPVRGDFTRLPGIDDVLKVKSTSLLEGQPDNYWQGGYYVGLFGRAYHITTGKIESSTEDELIIGKERSAAWFVVPTSSTSSDGNHYNYGYIVGHKNALNTEGEWIKDGDYIYMIPEDGVNLNSATVSVKKRNLVVDLNDKSFVNVIGFETIGGSIRMDNSRMCMANGLDMKYISHYIHTADGNTGYIDFTDTIENKKYTDKINGEDVTTTYPRYKTYTGENGAPERGAVGNYISGTDNIFINNKIDHSAGAGVFLSGAYSYIDNNDMTDVGYAGSVVAGINVAPKTYEGMYANVYGGHGVYNNTVANTGRSCWNVNSYKGSQMPYMPCEIAYNDFHDGMLTSADTGITYEYFANMGYDGIMTRLHHNYIYLTTDKNDYNPYSNGIFHDGSSFGTDTYKNKIFYTQKGSGYSHNNFVEQSAAHAPASMTWWDNTQIGYLPGGTSSLDEGYFTEEKAFYAGVKDSDYLINYDNFKLEDDYGMGATTLSANFEKSSGVQIDEASKYADFSADGEWVKFRLNAPSGANTLALAVRGDNHYTYDVLDIYIVNADDANGMSSTSAQHYKGSVDIGAHDLDTPEMVYLHINEISGMKDIYVKATDYRSAEIGGVSAFVAEGTKGDDRYAMKGYAGNFNEQGSSNVTPDYRNPFALGTAYVKSSGAGYLVYKNCTFNGASDKFVISAYTPTSVNGNITVYVTTPGGSRDSALATASLDVPKEPLAEEPYQLVDISTVPAGSYDVHLYLSRSFINVRDFGFLKTTTNATEFERDALRVYAGKYNTSSSISGNESFPLRAVFVNPPNFDAKGIANAYAGSTLVYDNINIPSGCTTFKINYAAAVGNCVDKVEVYLDSISGTPVATVTGMTGGGVLDFRQATAQVSGISGEYTIYLKFIGDGNENVKVDWFSFN